MDVKLFATMGAAAAKAGQRIRQIFGARQDAPTPDPDRAVLEALREYPVKVARPSRYCTDPQTGGVRRKEGAKPVIKKGLK